MKKITSFNGKYRFLSNFWPAEVYLNEEIYPSIEHAYQAAKTLNKEEREEIRSASTASIAKKLGQHVTIRTDWEDIKFEVMYNLVQQKFNHSPLKELLLETGDAILEEGNWWHDTTWGICPEGSGIGQNLLGLLLMKVRDEIKTWG
jgi:ribA/ribD-fused uncharacterized protein